MVYQTQHALSEDVTTTKTTKIMQAEIMRKATSYGLVEDKVDDDADVGDGGDGCVLIRGEGSRLLLRIYDYDNE